MSYPARAEGLVNMNRHIQHLASLCFFHRRLIQDWILIPGSTAPRLSPKTAWHVYSTDCRLQLTAENFHHYVYFWYPHISSHAIHMAFSLSLIYLKIQRHILFFEIHTNWPVKRHYVTGSPNVNLFFFFPSYVWKHMRYPALISCLLGVITQFQ